jgi:3-methylcrotonyl-CoA carboxylase alpha subunit
LVKPGDQVSKGAPLVVLEAMKMEHVIKAPTDGTIEKVFFKVGDTVAEGKALLQLDTPEDEK